MAVRKETVHAQMIENKTFRKYRRKNITNYTRNLSPELFFLSLFPHKQQEHHVPSSIAIYHPSELQ